MKTPSRLVFLICVLMASSLSRVAASTVAWDSDLPGALTRAHGTKRLVLIFFRNPNVRFNWELREEILSTPYFLAYANDHLELVEVDVTTAERRVEKMRWVRTYGVTNYPTLVVLSSTGENLAHFGYLQGGPKSFVRELKRIEAGQPVPSFP